MKIKKEMVLPYLVTSIIFFVVFSYFSIQEKDVLKPIVEQLAGSNVYVFVALIAFYGACIYLGNVVNYFLDCLWTRKKKDTEDRKILS